eukprot:Amastigsp_a3502_48.p2 type:complete len:102 gc:universal Amastigsp_a3502_48:303-608(+)
MCSRTWSSATNLAPQQRSNALLRETRRAPSMASFSIASQRSNTAAGASLSRGRSSRSHAPCTETLGLCRRFSVVCSQRSPVTLSLEARLRSQSTCLMRCSL